MKNKLNKSGIAFVTAVVMMVLFLNLGLGYLVMARTELQIARNQLSSVKAFYNSESALQHSLAELLNNVDANGDGLGNIPPTDIDGDSVADYSAVYTSGTGIVSSSGNTGTEGIVRAMEVKLTPKKWTGAMQVGRNIGATLGNSGTINGNVDAKGTINISGITQGSGTRTPNNTALVIPTPSMASYQGIANYVINGNTTWVSTAPPSGNGMYYINGNLTIIGVNNFNLLGSLIVSGTLTVNSCIGTLTIQPTGSNPAIVAGTNVSMTTVPRLIINGLVYAGQDIVLSSGNSPNQITGAIVAGRDLTLNTMPGEAIIFDSAVNPPYFVGSGSGYNVSYWKGHR